MTESAPSNEALQAKLDLIDQKLEQLAQTVDIVIKKMDTVEGISHQLAASILEAYNNNNENDKQR
jgi:hypothetical protein